LLEDFSNSTKNASGHNSIAFSHIRHNRYHPTAPIFLLTKSILC
jgi:hypothetical protein